MGSDPKTVNRLLADKAQGKCSPILLADYARPEETIGKARRFESPCPLASRVKFQALRVRLRHSTPRPMILHSSVLALRAARRLCP